MNRRISTGPRRNMVERIARTGSRIVLGVAMMWGATRAMAQTTPGGEYYINGIFNPVIADARKQDLRPEPIDTVLPNTPMTYDMIPVRGEVPARVDSIEAAKLNIQLAQQRLYKGFAKAGFGLYVTPLAELYFDQTRNKKSGYGVHYKHFSSAGGLKDLGPSAYSFNQGDAFYSAYLKEHEVTGRLMYDRRRVSYYGYTSNDSIKDVLEDKDLDKDDRKQVYNDIGFAARVRSLYPDSTKLAHDVGLEVHNYRNLTGSNETNVRLDARLGYQQGHETYGGKVLIDNNAYRGVLGGGLQDDRINGILIGAEPCVSTRGDKYSVKVGAGIFLDSQGETTFHFYPQAYLDYHLFGEILVPYAGVDGRRIRNNFRSLTRENPWLHGAPLMATVDHRSAIRNYSLMYDIYGGLRGNVSSDIGFDVRVSASRTKDWPLYVNSTTMIDSVTAIGDRFLVVYDDVKQLDISGALTYSHDEHIDLTGRIDVYTYTPSYQAEPWNLPPYKLSLGARYDFRDKLIAKFEAQFLGARKGARAYAATNGITGEPYMAFESHDLKGYVDLYLGAEYRYTKRFSLFLDVSNLSASKYERWYRYPVQRVLLVGGATYAF
ncbi:MAG: hypothetical protein JST41_08445 [Bacteroidetes bacterium]|nr:hypothetical protein [Bacteroidota bacterium]